MNNEEVINDNNYNESPASSSFGFVDPQKYLSDIANGQAANFINAGIGKYNSEIQENIQKTQSTLRTYFNVNTKSIVSKLQKILFPLTVKDWSRSVPEEVPHVQAVNHNLPELYIPIVFTFLFILLTSLSNIVNGTFSFANVTYTFTKFFVIVILMVLLTKLLFYVGCQITSSIFTLFADLCYTFMASFYWTIKTMRSQSGMQTKPKPAHTYSILLIAVLQGLIPLFFVKSCGCAKKIPINTEVTQ